MNNLFYEIANELFLTKQYDAFANMVAGAMYGEIELAIPLDYLRHVDEAQPAKAHQVFTNTQSLCAFPAYEIGVAVDPIRLAAIVVSMRVALERRFIKLVYENAATVHAATPIDAFDGVVNGFEHQGAKVYALYVSKEYVSDEFKAHTSTVPMCNGEHPQIKPDSQILGSGMGIYVREQPHRAYGSLYVPPVAVKQAPGHTWEAIREIEGPGQKPHMAFSFVTEFAMVLDDINAFHASQLVGALE